MKNVIAVADLFKEDWEMAGRPSGGAELNDAVALQYFRQKKILKQSVKCTELTPQKVEENLDCLFFICNFWSLGELTKKTLASSADYVIYEHDYKFLKNRNPVTFPNFKVPSAEYHHSNIDFYQKAQKVICLSEMHRDIFTKNIQLNNICNINCSLFTDDKIKMLLDLSKTPKTKDYAIIDDPNPTKRRDSTIDWCHRNDIKFDLISHPDNRSFLEILAAYKHLVFMTGHPEPTPRIAVETKLMGVNLIAPKQLIGVAHEYWWKWSPEEIAAELAKIREEAYKLFEECVNGSS